MTVTGKTLKQNLKGVKNAEQLKNQTVVLPVKKALRATGGHGHSERQPGARRLRWSKWRAWPSSNTAARRACLTPSKRAPKLWPARKIKAGDVVVIRYEGPRGGPGMPRDAFGDRRVAWGRAWAMKWP